MKLNSKESSYIARLSKILEHPDDESIEDLKQGHDADTKKQTKEAASARQKPDQCHPLRLFIF